MRTTRFWNNLHQVTLKVERLESQIIIKVLRAGKPKTTYCGLNYFHWYQFSRNGWKLFLFLHCFDTFDITVG